MSDISWLSFTNNIEGMKKLLDERPDRVNETNEYGSTPLHNAAYWGRREVCEMLLDRGAEISARNKAGHTPLNYAAEGFANEGNIRVLELLLEKGADVSETSQPALREYISILTGNKNLLKE